MRALKGARGPVTGDERGSLLEGFTWMLLQLYEGLRTIPPHEVYYWSPAETTRTEVDFLLVAGNDKLAIEVKSSARVRTDHFVGLRAVAGLSGLRRRILVSLAEERGRTRDDIEVMPFAGLLEELEQGTLFKPAAP